MQRTHIRMPLSQKQIPHPSELVEYNYAVAGHDGTLCDTEGELFIKPCTQAEIDFYQLLPQKHSRMLEIVPEFVGSLSLNAATDINSITEQLPVVDGDVIPEMKEQVLELISEKTAELTEMITPTPMPAPTQDQAPGENVTWIPNASRKIPTDKAVVLDNAAYGFRRPNIVDVKLGQRLWADDAPLEKKRRFDKISAETTHRELGFRIAGMRVYKGSNNPEDLDEEDYRIYDKDYGRKDVNCDNIVEAFRGFLYNRRAGIDDEYARAVAEAFLRDLKHVCHVLENEETRMYSSSLLFIFEGDGPALKAEIDEQSRSTAASVKARTEEDCLPGRTTNRIDSGIGLDDEGEIVFPTQEQYDELSESDEDADEQHIWRLKLIDFAHAAFVPGQGPDENILLGVRSLITIFEELSKDPEKPVTIRKERRST
ncbi:hypothetical protein Daus18300_002692 [Diaporthe australafricana]|uniref:Kinase n=1 Tax=Diaporthe australafricana TaxID=127596 RepID=A0ABR3XLB4_9PEZI